MKRTLYHIAIATSVALTVQAASAAVLLSDNFDVIPGASSTDNNQNMNANLDVRQSGVLAPAPYIAWHAHHQIGNTGTDAGQPGAPSYGGYVLTAFEGNFFNSLDMATAASGPLTIEIDMYSHNGDWIAMTLRGPGDSWVIAGSGEFGILKRPNGGLQMFQNGGNMEPGGWDTAGFASDPHMSFTFTDTAGTGSAFNGNGSQVIVSNGAALLGTVTLTQLNSSGLKLGFRAAGNSLDGLDNLVISGTPGTAVSPGQNLSFEYDVAPNGSTLPWCPVAWTRFNGEAGNADIGTGHPTDNEFLPNNPLTAPADGSQYLYVNSFNGQGLKGVFQDFGPMQSNRVYTLTVAIGSRLDRLNSPGIIQLVTGGDNTGTVRASGGGLPATQGTWEDYSISFTNATSTAHLFAVLGAMGADSVQADFDNVRLTSVGISFVAPTITADVKPPMQRVATGTAMSFSVAADGTAPLIYQWFTQSGPIANATNATYAFNAVAGTNGYYVTVSNLAGVVGSATGVVVSATNIVTVNNFSFEDGSTPAFGNGAIPLAWSSFNGDWAGLGTGPGFPAQDGSMYLAINTGPGHSGASGMYQDVGALLPNTTYELTVAIGRSTANGVPPNGPGDWSPGILSLINGTNSAGTLLATTTGYPDTAGTWQDYSVTFITGPSVSGDLTVAVSVPPANTYQGTFDNVRLTKSAAPAVIPPTLLSDITQRRSAVKTGMPMSYAVTVNGAPLNYQWYTQNGPIVGATANSYSFNAVMGTNTYYVVITNTAGSATSATAVVISAPDIVTVQNFSFENGSTPHYGNGALPLGWTSFNDDWAGLGTSGGGFDAPDGNTFFAVNTGPGHAGASGIYQDVGPLLPNATYTLTVAIGRSTANGVPPNGPGDWSPGNILLLNGTDSAGVFLAGTVGYPDTVGTFQDYTATITTDSSASGDLVVVLSDDPASTYQATFDNVRLTRTGGPSTPPVLGTPHVSGGNLIITGTGGTPNAPYTWLSTTNLAAPVVWTTNSTGSLDGAGAISSSLPIGTERARFFRLSLP